MSAHENFLLANIDARAFEELLPHGNVVRLTSGDVIAETRVEIDRVYFPHNGIISCVVALTGGGVIETAMIGRDGAFGITLSMDGRRAFNDAVVQVSGEATTFDVRVFSDIAERYPGFRKQILTYEQFHLAEVQQTAACNAIHSVLARTCRWLLRMYDLVGVEIAVTQEGLSQMMGVRRTSVTDAAKVLQNSGAITISRGHVKIVDLAKISAHSCECHANVARNYRRLRHRER